MNAPLLLTLLRLLTAPLFYFFYSQQVWLNLETPIFVFILFALVTISEGSDVADGYLARKLNQVTDLGKVLDPMTDSLYRLTLFFTFTLPPISLPLAIPFLFLYRDCIIAMLRTTLALKGSALAARTSGKIKAILQGISSTIIVFFLLPFSYGYFSLRQLQDFSFWVALTTAIYSVGSGFEYIVAHWLFMRKLLNLSGALKAPSK